MPATIRAMQRHRPHRPPALRRVLLAAAILGVAGTELRAAPDDTPTTLYSAGDLVVGGKLEAGFGYFGARNIDFGRGNFNSTDGNRRRSRNWFEGYLKPTVTAEYALDGLGVLYGQASAIGAFTRGEGDAVFGRSTTSYQPENVEPEDYFIGWRSDSALPSLGTDALDVSVGHQKFTIGDGFLILDGTADGWGRAAYYLAPRNAFRNTAIVRLNTSPVRADLFHLEADVDQQLLRGNDVPRTKLFGANVEWFASEPGRDDARIAYQHRLRYVGLTFLHVYSAEDIPTDNTPPFAYNQASVAANRRGLNVLAPRLGGSWVPALPGLMFYGEYAREWNNEQDRKIDANAWFVEPRYEAKELPLKPALGYRFAHFSGDGNPSDGRDTSFDPLFYGTGKRGTGTWYVGEIFGQYAFFNSNVDVQQISLKVSPADPVTLGLLLYRFDLDRPRQYAGVTARHYMNEVDGYVEWTPAGWLKITAVAAAARPGAAARQISVEQPSGPDGKTIYLGELFAHFTF